MMRCLITLTTLMLVFFSVSAVSAASNVLTWTDNSTNETAFEVWAKLVPTPTGNPPPPPNCVADPSPYARLATLGTNVVTFTHASLEEGAAWCYEVRATNPVGPSAFSNQAGRSVPFTAVNGAASALTVVGGP